MDNGAQIWLIDTHAKGNGRDHDLNSAGEEFFLDPLAIFGLEPGVIGRRGKAPGKFRGQRIRLLASRRVDDAWPAAGIEQ